MGFAVESITPWSSSIEQKKLSFCSWNHYSWSAVQLKKMAKKRDMSTKIAFHFEISPCYKKKLNNQVKFSFLPWSGKMKRATRSFTQNRSPFRKLGKHTRSNAGQMLCSTSTTCSHHLRLLPLNPSSNPPTNRGQNSSKHTHYTHIQTVRTRR